MILLILGLIFCFLFWRSFPFVYHLRMFYHIFASYFQKRLESVDEVCFFFVFVFFLLLFLVFLMLLFFSSILLQFQKTCLYFRAWPDDLDWNMHMGNSSYNKFLSSIHFSLHLLLFLILSSSRLADFARYHHFARFGLLNVAGLLVFFFSFSLSYLFLPTHLSHF